jgi:hypothetical protein
MRCGYYAEKFVVASAVIYLYHIMKKDEILSKDESCFTKRLTM